MGLDFLEQFYEKYHITDGTQVVISLVFIFLVAFLLTRITKKLKLPNVTAYIFAGILIGPYVLNLVPQADSETGAHAILDNMSFITDVGLGFIAFASGRYFNLKMIRRNGWKPAIIALIQAFVTSVVVFFVLLPFNLPAPIVLVIASIGGTTSSASTLMTIREYHCEGEFVDYAIELDAIDDVFGLLSFSVCSGIALGIMTAQNGGANFSQWETIWLPIIVNAGIVVLGFLVGWFMAKVAISPTRSKDNRLILMVAAILFLVGICGLAKVINKNILASPLLCVMVMAATYLNFTNDDEMFSQVADFSAPIILLFFVLSGMNFKISYMVTVGVIGVVYFFARLIMKYVGNFLGGLATKSPATITKYIGLTMEPQAGISIGLAALALNMFTADPSLNLSQYGEEINAIIIFSGILYEIAGPALAKLSLKLSGVLKEENRTKVKKGSELPMVISTESSLRDFVEIKAPTPEMIRKLNNLNKMKEQCDVMDRYVHTKAYTQEDTTPSSKT
ncbi:MAG: cation:proton antiporter [Bacilli bacterium]|jgi:Kef-type K+ transport system membrane component KefB|nr:cation:proton antiporter [Bacilli bacterium]